MAVEWEDPGEGRKRPVSYEEEAAEYRAKPGEWGVLVRVENASKKPVEAQYARTLASNIRGGNYAAFKPAGHWEATTRTVSDLKKGKVVTVYVRYTGPVE